ncbi:hypothetical protein D3C74_436830 [compost metagenome]
MLLKADQNQQILDLALNFRLRRTGQTQRKSDIVIYRSGRQQIEVLKDHPDLAPLLLQLALAEAGQLDAIHPDLTLRRALQQIDAADQRAFSCTGMTDHAEDFTLLNGQI